MNGTEWVEVIVNEQEELFPQGRTNPRWIVWRNKGKGVFEETIILDSKPCGHELQVRDVDGDGKLDICSKPGAIPMEWRGRKSACRFSKEYNRQKIAAWRAKAGLLLFVNVRSFYEDFFECVIIVVNLHLGLAVSQVV